MSKAKATVIQTVVLVAAGMLALTVALVANAASPTLNVPVQATLNSTITVSGHGFRADQSGNLTYNGGVVVTFRASGQGTFSKSLTIPSWARVGAGRISAKTAKGELIATSTLTISGTPGSVAGSPKPTASPASTASAGGTSGASTIPGVVNPSASPTATPTASASAPSAAPSTAPSNVPNWSHVYVIVLENHEYSQIVGSSSAPYINSLIARYGLATSYYAANHPSEPNYVAMTSGGTQGVTDDGTYNLGANNIYKTVEASGRTWHEWEQGWPGNCYAGGSASSVVDGPGKAGAYARKHNPAIIYTSVSGNATECSHISNLASFNPGVANFNFITPNLINDMHDGSIADGDNFVKAFLPSILNSSSFANSVVFLTFDEGSTNTNGGGHVVTIPITSGMTPGYRDAATYNHYSMLRTIEDAWGLPHLGATASAAVMNFPW